MTRAAATCFRTAALAVEDGRLMDAVDAIEQGLQSIDRRFVVRLDGTTKEQVEASLIIDRPMRDAD